MRLNKLLFSVVLWVALMGLGLCLTGCPDRSHSIGLPPLGDAGEDALVGDGGTDGQFPDTGIGVGELLVARVAPDHGPAVGGNVVVVRGTGFTEDATVHVGGSLVQPADTRLIDDRRLQIVVPAGAVGPADVTVEVAGSSVTLEDGYTYDAFFLDPDRGSVSGGTHVTITGTGTAFASSDTVEIGASACANVEIVSATVITCDTPSGVVGTADVTVVSSADGTFTTVKDAFEYYETSDPIYGGLGGGPIAGTLNVTALDGMGLAVEGAFVIVGEELSTEYQGLTDLRGSITFSGPDLAGPVTVHVAKDCFEKTSVVAFNAQNVTVFLTGLQLPRCGSPGAPPGGRTRQGSYVSGELIWAGPHEYGPNLWSNIPDPRDGEVKVAYVYTTQRCAGDGEYCVNPDPSTGGGMNRILEVIPENTATRSYLGYPYRIFVRPAGLAVYALAGLENPATGAFLPYVMGIARSVLAAPGDEVTEVNVEVNIPLDHRLDVTVDDLPEPVATGPDRFVVEGDIDLGGEGFIVRRDPNGQRIDVLRGRSAENPYRFWTQPALLGHLSDGRYRVAATWATGDFEDYPLTTVVRSGILSIDEGVVLDGFAGIPIPVAPEYAGSMPSDRILRWDVSGSEPSFFAIVIQGGDGQPAWLLFVPGSLREAPIPDLSTIPDIPDIASGYVAWAIFAINIPSFDFNEFNYSQLYDRYWDGYALDSWYFQL